MNEIDYYRSRSAKSAAVEDSENEEEEEGEEIIKPPVTRYKESQLIIK